MPHTLCNIIVYALSQKNVKLYRVMCFYMDDFYSASQNNYMLFEKFQENLLYMFHHIQRNFSN